MRRVLVTGGHGFIGAQCVGPLLAGGFEVHVVSLSGGPAVSREAVHRLDLMDSSSVQALMRQLQPSHLLHLAWETTPGQFWNSPRNRDWRDASLSLFDAFTASGGRRFVGAGSCAEYDWSSPLLDEVITPLRPATPYGQAKNETRERLEQMALAAGISFAWGRTFFLYGPGEKEGRLVGDVIRSLLQNKPVATTEGSQVLDYMHVADVGAAFAMVTSSGVEGAINIASGDAHRVRDILEIIAGETGRGDLVQYGARPNVPGQPARLEASIARLMREVRFTPTYKLMEGLKDTVRRMRAESI